MRAGIAQKNLTRYGRNGSMHMVWHLRVPCESPIWYSFACILLPPPFTPPLLWSSLLPRFSLLTPPPSFPTSFLQRLWAEWKFFQDWPGGHRMHILPVHESGMSRRRRVKLQNAKGFVDRGNELFNISKHAVWSSLFNIVTLWGREFFHSLHIPFILFCVCIL